MAVGQVVGRASTDNDRARAPHTEAIYYQYGAKNGVYVEYVMSHDRLILVGTSSMNAHNV